MNTENRGVAKKHRTMGVASRHNQDSMHTNDDSLYPGEEEGDVLPPAPVPGQGQQVLLQTVFLKIVDSFHERTFTLRFLGIILRVLRLEVSVWIS